MVSAVSLIHRIFIVAINVTAIWLAILVFFHNPKGRVNRNYLFATILIFIWINFSYLSRFIGLNNKELSLQFLRIAWLITPFFAISIYFLVLNLLNKLDIYPLLTKTIVIAGALTGLIAGFTPFVFSDISFYEGDVVINYEPGMFGYLAFILIFFIITLYVISKGYREADALNKKKIEYFLVGLASFYILNTIFNIILPFLGIVRYYYAGDYSTVLLLGFIGYAITKRELFGIKTVITGIFVGLITVLMSLDTLVFTENLISRIIKILTLAVFIYFGYLLIRSVTREIRQREEIEKLSKAKSEFISIASHQLRTPPTAIKGWTSMVLEGTYGRIGKKIRTVLEKVYYSNERMIGLINDLLNVSRIESGTLELDLEKASLDKMISSILDELRIGADEKKLYLKWEKSKEPLPEITIDPGKIRQVILNIIDNSIKYTEKGGITVKTEQREPSKQWSQGSILITIKDTGTGMTEEEIKKIFESFTRGRAGAKHLSVGLGLGLYVVRKFTELHGGKVWAESAGRNKGSTFYIELPMRYL